MDWTVAGGIASCLSLVVGLGGVGIGVYQWTRRRREHAEAWRELENVYSIARHLEYWLVHPTTTNSQAHGTSMLGQIHQLMISVKIAATRYSKDPLVPTSPFPEPSESASAPAVHQSDQEGSESSVSSPD